MLKKSDLHERAATSDVFPYLPSVALTACLLLRPSVQASYTRDSGSKSVSCVPYPWPK